MEEKQGYAAALDQLTSELLSERQNVMGFIKGLRDQRDESCQVIQAKTVAPVLQSSVRLVPLHEQILIHIFVLRVI